MFDLLGTRIYTGDSQGRLREFSVDPAALKVAVAARAAGGEVEPHMSPPPGGSSGQSSGEAGGTASGGVATAASSNSPSLLNLGGGDRRSIEAPLRGPLRGLRACDDFTVRRADGGQV